MEYPTEAHCIDCGQLISPTAIRCHSCATKFLWQQGLYPEPLRGNQAHTWRGGSRRQNGGYIERYVPRDSPFYSMAQKNGYVLEHRLVVAEFLGRLLLKTELVHHKNGIKDDNRLENLELMPNPYKHNQFRACANCELRKEIRLLHWQIKELTKELQGKLI